MIRLFCDVCGETEVDYGKRDKEDNFLLISTREIVAPLLSSGRSKVEEICDSCLFESVSIAFSRSGLSFNEQKKIISINNSSPTAAEESGSDGIN